MGYRKRVLTTSASDSMLDAIFKASELNGWFPPISPHHLSHLSSMPNGLSARLAKCFASICKSYEIFVALLELGKRLGRLREGTERRECKCSEERRCP